MSSTVLIVDDDRELCDLLIEFLQLEDFQASAVHDGREAVNLCRTRSFDAIVLDIMLPGLQGLEDMESRCKVLDPDIEAVQDFIVNNALL